MDLSIIIVSYNTKDLTLQCIKSIISSKPKVRHEIIVVDNASTDGTIEALKDRYPNLNLIQNDSNLGFAKANNQGIKKARGNYILLLNSDTKVKKGAIDKMYEFAKKTPDAGVVGAKLLNPDGSAQGSVFRLPTIQRAIKQYWLGQKKLLDKYVPNTKTPTKVEALVMAAFLITPNALKKVGLLDERYFMYFEDLEYCRKVKDSDLKIYYLPSAEVTHIHGGSGGDIDFLERSSRVYHGIIKHYLIWFIMWTGQKLGQ